ALGGLSEVLNGETGEQIKSTLQTINTVANALSGLNSANIVLGSGSGTSLKGGGAGGGGTGGGGRRWVGGRPTGGGERGTEEGSAPVAAVRAGVARGDMVAAARVA